MVERKERKMMQTPALPNIPSSVYLWYKERLNVSIERKGYVNCGHTEKDKR
jgi:hypothetical protein